MYVPVYVNKWIRINGIIYIIYMRSDGLLKLWKVVVSIYRLVIFFNIFNNSLMIVL
jgi:hypothetical protein